MFFYFLLITCIITVVSGVSHMVLSLRDGSPAWSVCCFIIFVCSACVIACDVVFMFILKILI